MIFARTYLMTASEIEGEWDALCDAVPDAAYEHACGLISPASGYFDYFLRDLEDKYYSELEKCYLDKCLIEKRRPFFYEEPDSEAFFYEEPDIEAF